MFLLFRNRVSHRASEDTDLYTCGAHTHTKKTQTLKIKIKPTSTRQLKKVFISQEENKIQVGCCMPKIPET